MNWSQSGFPDDVPHNVVVLAGTYKTKCYGKELVMVPNRANSLHSYILQHWPSIKDEQGVWVVGSTAYMLAEGREPKGDLDLVCTNQATVERVTRLLSPSTASERTYLGGERVLSDGKQVDVWSLKPGQSIDEAIKGFSDTHPQARVAYEIATGKLTVYPNDQVF